MRDEKFETQTKLLRTKIRKGTFSSKVRQVGVTGQCKLVTHQIPRNYWPVKQTIQIRPVARKYPINQKTR